MNAHQYKDNQGSYERRSPRAGVHIFIQGRSVVEFEQRNSGTHDRPYNYVEEAMHATV
jgi:hypothetical protein